ncbi:MAG: enoyl-CoA hydratase/isomerase family protein [Candidatus Sericytochromatia bacterium]|nr:enoyl-CoA hydratase/isomerase family protein [Candidatus Sericytochromatia bacterium]
MATRTKVSHRDDVAFLTLSSSDGLHVLSLQAMAELREVLQQLAGQPALRAVVLTAEGSRAFSAGADLRELARLQPEAAIAFSQAGQATTLALAQLEVPTIAVLPGPAFGGGVELALACDFRLLETRAQLHYRAAELGLLPGWGGTQRLPRLVGEGRASWMMMACEPVPAIRAAEWGLAHGVAAGPELDAALTDWLARLVRLDVTALGAIKAAIRAHAPFNFEAEQRAFAACFASGATQARIETWLRLSRAATASPPTSPSASAGSQS